MNRLLKAQLKKVYGKNFDLEQEDEKFKKFVALINEGYSDLYQERKLLDQTLEINAQELTERNIEIDQSHKLMKSVTNSVDDVIFYKDLNYNYIGCNTKFEKIVGLTEEEILGKNDYELFNKENADAFREIDKRMIRTLKGYTSSEWVSLPNGKKLYFTTTKTPLLNSNYEVIGSVGVSRDITEEHTMKNKLQEREILLIQQNRLASMGEMIGNIAHQWRQPLNALGLGVQKIGFYHNRDLLDGDKLQEIINKSMALIKGMSETIDDFRDFFNPNKEKVDFNVNDAIEKAYFIVEPLFSVHYIDYTFKSEGKYFINGFNNEFSQVILNILNNAKDALVENNVENPKILVDVSQDKNDKIMIKISNNGLGISKKVLAKIFDPYFTTKEEGKGSGLGLYMSKIIIEEHMKGTIEVQSQVDATVFTIVI